MRHEPKKSRLKSRLSIPVIFQVASWLAALTHPSHIVLYDIVIYDIVIYDIVIYDIVIYAPGDSLPCRRDPS
ncbi:hypothetical protein [Photorhabdus heterorhabditis]|uniref:hypothetical protein n=1 Tax=Photorhabdus heterorhabditis TaxID=880156 RepID=UPI001561EDC0|nr:hypothetical protein [Photorhabdus heterorhabditis]NRN29641.1 hypothetical protein [Photorhabdus heterorhabditis subsp. aluminescens]